ncbi:SKA complex subunit 3 [Nelusetta ayraudi]|uniref:SKA complex subunit 3 n=1 Tax=Nelusetta ayraudi TaxID=303726 RepID=UPI003F72DD96
MEPTTQFFAKLKKLGVTLESETAKLLEQFEKRHDECDTESQQRGLRAYHELNCEVGDTKRRIQKHVAEQKVRQKEVDDFIRDCRLTEERVSADVQALKGFFQKYGYRPSQNNKETTSTTCQESGAGNQVTDEEAESMAAGEEGSSLDQEGSRPTSPPAGAPPPVADVMQTPKLSDFGLSEMMLKRALARAERCPEEPPMPNISFTQAALVTPEPPPISLTPKCALRLDDDELVPPRFQDFGLSESTMSLNNDFTMNLLLQKKVAKPQSISPLEVPDPVNQLMKDLQAKAENLESPEPPVFLTPSIKIKKTKNHCLPSTQTPADPESPELPVLQTPYLKQFVSSKKPTPATSGTAGDKRAWECSVPEISIQDVDDEQVPEMPNLESVWAKSFQSKDSKRPKRSDHEHNTQEPEVSGTELEIATQEFSFGTPRLRKEFQEPSTPEMPDLSSVTQDICKMVSQMQSKGTAMAIVQPNVRENKENISVPRVPAVTLPVVSESEFQSLPSYLRIMTLHNLNQAIHGINKHMGERPGGNKEFQMEELKKITNVGAKTPVYIICLTELKRLMHVGGTKANAVYKVCAHS